MKRHATFLLLIPLIPASAQITKTASSLPIPVIQAGKSGIKLGTWTALERRFDAAYIGIGNIDNPLQILGPTRGVYLEGYGAVITTELELVATPGPSPFLTTIPPELVTRARKQKSDRLPALRQKMTEMMQAAALTLPQVPEDQQIVIAVRLDYRPWENTTGLPRQILMRSDRKTAMLGKITTTEDQ